MLGDSRPPLDQFFVDGMRGRIEVAKIVDKLNELSIECAECALGKIVMTKMQMQAANAFRGLASIALAKVIPDLQTTELRLKPAVAKSRTMLTDDELMNVATGKSDVGESEPHTIQ